MCTKHQACRSEKVALNPSQSGSCSSPNITSIKQAGVSTVASDCCSSTSCSSGGEHTDEESDPKLLSTTGLTHSWKIDGMDCPSCARKIETAVNKVEGVVDARVLFATEKLIINASHSGVASLVEQAILDTGFTFQTPTSAPKVAKPSGWKSVVVQNSKIIAIASAMAVAAMISPVFPFGE